MKAAAGKVQQEAERLTAGLWLPMLLSAGYLLVLSANRASFHAHVDNPNGAYSTAWPGVPATMTALYLAMVFGGSKYFESRKPMSGLKDYMFTYNLYQVIINVWCIVAFLVEVRRAGMSVVGNKVDVGPSSFRLGFVTWVHYNNKYVELLDTVWMVLRKKSAQVSFLHVYHHCLLMWAWFIVIKFGNGGDAYFGGMLNSIIHVMMYSYYTMALLGWSCPWKRYLTQAQLLQFCVCLAHSIWAAVTGVYPWRICLVEVWVMVSMLVLFTRFYNESYAKERASKAQALEAKAATAKAQ
ncbi:hypothetical protein KFE25_008510 [Diacronema lutheri]|uniref:Elongation of fatty acids protein n=2 Tax=Diacronema lutheri TaxID=2081491 RepID=A0A8J5Y2L3_DIALT|nr:hypothetical protein KFE25_008510 [Diacronema lutheri]